MASSPIPEFGPLRAPQGVHLLLSVGIPTVFWDLLVYWVSGVGPSWPWAPLGLVYAVILGFWAPWRLRTRQGPLMKWWIWSVATLGLYGSLALIEGGPWPQRLFAGNQLIWFLSGFLPGQFTALWAGQLASRARLYQLIEGIPSGKALEERVREYQLDADFSRSNAGTLSGSLIVLGVLAVGAAQFSGYGKGGLSAFLAGAFVVLCLLVGVLIRMYRREMAALMYGRRYTFAEKAASLGWSVLLVVLGALGAWGLMALGGPWIDWDQLLRGTPGTAVPVVPPVVEKPPVVDETPEGDPRLLVLLALLQIIFRVKNLGAGVQFLLVVATWAVPVVFVAFLLWPLVRWFAAGGRETKGLGRRWWSLLRDQLAGFWTTLVGWWHRPGTAVDSLTTVSSPQEWLRSLFRRPPKSRVPYPEVVEGFLTLVRWAEPITPYHQGETTREFLDRLATLMPWETTDLGRVRDLLDRELFGPQGLDSAGRRAFLALVARLTATPPSHDDPPGVS